MNSSESRCRSKLLFQGYPAFPPNEGLDRVGQPESTVRAFAQRFDVRNEVPCMPKVLLLTSDEEEASILLKILGNYALLVRAKNLSEMSRRLEEEGCDLLLCAWVFYRSFWNGALQEVRERYPDLPVVILSRTGGEREWLEVLEAGAFDLLGIPCQKSALLSVIEQAVVSHETRKARRLAEGNKGGFQNGRQDSKKEP